MYIAVAMTNDLDNKLAYPDILFRKDVKIIISYVKTLYKIHTNSPEMKINSFFWKHILVGIN